MTEMQEIKQDRVVAMLDKAILEKEVFALELLYEANDYIKALCELGIELTFKNEALTIKVSADSISEFRRRGKENEK